MCSGGMVYWLGIVVRRCEWVKTDDTDEFQTRIKAKKGTCMSFTAGEPCSSVHKMCFIDSSVSGTQRLGHCKRPGEACPLVTKGPSPEVEHRGLGTLGGSIPRG